MADSSDANAGERTRPLFFAAGMFSAYDADNDGYLDGLEQCEDLLLVRDEAGENEENEQSDLLDSKEESGKKLAYGKMPGGLDLVRRCINDARAVPLLTRKQEQRLFQDLEAARAVLALLVCVAAHATGDTLRRIMQLYLIGEEAADDLKQKIVLANLRFGIGVAAKYRYRGIDFPDLIQEAYIGLLRAVETFEWQRDFRFVTYASWWVHASIRAAIANQSRTIRFPIHVHEELARVGSAFYEFLKKNGGREPTKEELAAVLKWNVDQVEDAWRLLREQRTLSLDAPMRLYASRSRSDAEDTELGDFVADENAPSTEDQAAAALMKEKVHAMISSLTPREAEVICRRYGIGRKPESLQEIGDDLDLTRERIRQIEKQAMSKLRHPRRSKILRSSADNG